MSALNLLVVDWDFFFPNPTLSADLGHNAVLYLWDHSEAPIFQTAVVWAPRAAAFQRNGLELPMTEGWENFWRRFHFSEGVTVLYGDSNLHAGRIFPTTFGWDQPAWGTVSLWDAHHDCGYKRTISFEEWQARGVLSCEDWMLAHYGRGSTLEVIYPEWRKRVGTVEPEPLVPVDRRVDDGTTIDRPYHAVYVCRSGAWVPPWCDDQFSQFIEGAPDSWPTEIPGNEWVHPRPDVLQEARQQIRNWEQLQERLGE
ncbi:hypothetical protein [Streptomyces sp. MP131-18]|uniref:hypothetical protein n=1 Tax=Streptomyces sp. MP131-18 TaxID=1857892 RepID=UPI00097CB971|nr:hypothetical protein [Streptomyces sp. MP131-18]ONK13107.1 hypothetical protein STBA_38690 [Streptomyces sp. MP131-18]